MLWTAIVALALYALLPIVRNTFVGITGIEAPVHEAAVGMGLTSSQLLWMVELPLASPMILAGIRVAAVITVGVATIAAAIGAGGLGDHGARRRLLQAGKCGCHGTCLTAQPRQHQPRGCEDDAM